MSPDDSSPDVECLLRESSWLDALAQGLLADENDARDVAQDARIAALEKAPKDETHARAWLVRVTRHLAFKTLRSKSRRTRRESVAATREALPATADVIAKVHAQRRVVDAVLELEEPYRTVVLLRFFESLEPIEIARRQRVPPPTIRTRLHRALARLRVRLDSEFGDRSSWATLLLPAAKGVAASATAATTSLATKLGVAGATVAAGVIVWSVAAVLLKPGGKNEAGATASSKEIGRTPDVDVTGPDSSSRRTSRENDSPKTTDQSRGAASGHMRFVGRIVDARDRKPVAGAEFKICDEGAPRGAEVWSRTTSGADGRFDFVVESISSWMQIPEVRAPGFARWYRQGVSLDEAINVRRDRRFDFGDVELLRGASVTGRVVRGVDGSPVENAELRIFGDDERLYLMRDFPLCISRDVGRSRTDGSFELTERIEGDPTWPLRIFAIAGDRIGWATIDPDKSTEALEGIEVRVHEQAALSVAVRGVDGKPIPSAQVRCLPRFPLIGGEADELDWEPTSFAADSRIASIFEQQTDSSGRASFPKLPLDSDRARYDVFVDKIGYEKRVAYGVEITSAETGSVEIETQPVRKARVCGTVRDRDGKPVAEASVQCRWGGDDCVTKTDESGWFSFENISTDNDWYDISIEAEGFFDGSTERHLRDPLRRFTKHADSGDRPEFNTDFVLFRKSALHVRVVDEFGAPVQGARLEIRCVNVPDRSPTASLGLWRPEPRERIDRFRGDDSVWDVAAELDWSISTAAPLENRRLGPRTTVRVPRGCQEVVIHCSRSIPRGAHVAVNVSDASRGRLTRVSFASVSRVDGLGDGGAVQCDSSVVDIVGLMPGRWRLEFQTWDGKRALREFEVATPDDDLNLTASVGATARVVGRVEASENPAGTEPYDATRVHWSPPRGHAIDAGGDETYSGVDGTATPDAAGRFQVVGLTAGVTTHFFAQEGDAYDDVTITPSAAQEISVVLHPIPCAHWTLHAREDLSSGILAFDLATGDEPWHRELFCDHEPLEARAEVRPLKPGHHRWRALYLDPSADEPNRPAHAVEGEIDAKAGETVTIELEGLR